MTPPAMTQPAYQLARNATGRLVLTTAEGETHAGVVPVRAFPIGAPREGLSLVGPEGHELAWIDRLDDLPAALRDVIEEELGSLEFVPEIRRLKRVSTFSTPCTWEVETDRGDTSFVLKAEEDIRRLGRTTLQITGSQGVQFRVSDMTQLDRGSRRLLERFL